jgi:hypothetical protein
MEFCMDGDNRLVAIFDALSPENQAHLLTCARLSRIAENAVKKMIAAELCPASGPEYSAADRQEGKAVHIPFLYNEETKR